MLSDPVQNSSDLGCGNRNSGGKQWIRALDQDHWIRTGNLKNRYSELRRPAAFFEMILSII